MEGQGWLGQGWPGQGWPGQGWPLNAAKKPTKEQKKRLAELEKAAKKMAKAIYDGTLTEGNIDPEMTTLVAKHLHEAVLQGYNLNSPLLGGQGGSGGGISYNTPDLEMLSNLQKNVYAFSAAKNYQELKSLTLALTDDAGKLRKFKDFSNIARQIDKQYNITWLKTEYNTAIGSGQMAARWVEFEANKDAMPLLRYETAGDQRVRTDHRLLDGITRPVDDDFWDKYYPPNGWGCRCDVVQLPSGTETPSDKLYHPEVPQMWSVNLAKRGLAFPPGHPFYKGVPDEVLQQGEDLIKGYTEEDIRTLLYNKDFNRATQVVQIHPKYQNRPGFTTEELASINHYTSNGFIDLNDQLRSGNLSKFNAAFEKVLNHTLNKLPNDTQLSYFRGAPLTKDVLDTYKDYWKNGKTKTEDYFFSMSKDVNIAHKFKEGRSDQLRCLFKVRAKNGKDIASLSNATPESEVLLKSHSEFKIKNVKEVITENETYYEIDMEETD